MKFLGKSRESLRNLAVSVIEAFFAFIANALVSEYNEIPECDEYVAVSEYVDWFDFNANFDVSDFTEWAEFAEYPAKSEYTDEIEESDVLACLAWFDVSETNDNIDNFKAELTDINKEIDTFNEDITEAETELLKQSTTKRNEKVTFITKLKERNKISKQNSLNDNISTLKAQRATLIIKRDKLTENIKAATESVNNSLLSDNSIIDFKEVFIFKFF